MEKSEFVAISDCNGENTVCYQLFMRLYTKRPKKLQMSEFVAILVLQWIEKGETATSVINFSCGCETPHRKVGKDRICCNFSLQWRE